MNDVKGSECFSSEYVIVGGRDGVVELWCYIRRLDVLVVFIFSNSSFDFSFFCWLGWFFGRYVRVNIKLEYLGLFKCLEKCFDMYILRC